MHIFFITLENRAFKSVGPFQTSRQFESGDAILYKGKAAIILGTGSSRSDAKRQGTAYYNEVAKLHQDAEGDFQTQDIGAVGESAAHKSETENEPLLKRPRYK